MEYFEGTDTPASSDDDDDDDDGDDEYGGVFSDGFEFQWIKV
jgi:hypothetical protein